MHYHLVVEIFVSAMLLLAVRMAISIAETNAIAAYYEAQQSLRRAEFLQTTAAIMANEGQHLALLREALHREPVPNAFETGQP